MPIIKCFKIYLLMIVAVHYQYWF